MRRMETDVEREFQSTRPRGARRRHRSRRSRGRRRFNPRAHAGRDQPVGVGHRVSVGFNPRAHAGRDTASARWATAAPSSSIHAPTRGATRNCSSSSRGMVWFQSTRPRGARLVLGQVDTTRSNVSIHAPTRGATPPNSTLPARSSRFNPRAHAGRDDTAITSGWFFGCFNPRAHAGRDRRAGAWWIGQRRVSIHAPTRGATPIAVFSGFDHSSVSIHAPTRGATLKASCVLTRRLGFNPRAHAGRDMSWPAWRPRPPSFNPRAHAGRDRGLVRLEALYASFQSTRPRGARPGCRDRRNRRHAGFNPRAHAGRDQARRREAEHLDVSIHAPTRGATTRSSRAVWACTSFNPRAHAGRDAARHEMLASTEVFQSTRPRGARHARKEALVQRTAFQSTRPRGARQLCLEIGDRQAAFQSTRPRGARPVVPAAELAEAVVSIHAPTRGATRVHYAHRVGKKFQSTRPRGARRGRHCAAGFVAAVSIHAPTRGATPAGVVSAALYLFQSTRPRGARQVWRAIQRAQIAFQSTRPRGARLAAAVGAVVAEHVSIHAPTRGATRPARRASRCPGRFNPRAHAGRDAQSGARGTRRACFNPRAHAGRDTSPP